MEANLLLNEGERYGGKFVALRSYSEKDVVSSGDDPQQVFSDARKSGVSDPVIFYVPERGMVNIF
jgi:hypothetical protein